jgi:hypothetical protein
LQQELASVSPVRRWTNVATAAAATLVLAAATGYFFLHRPPKLTATDAIVVADFENRTADPVFDQTLRQGLTVQLEQSPFLRLVSDQSIQQALHLMNRPVDTRLTPEIAREICERAGSSAVLAAQSQVSAASTFCGYVPETAGLERSSRKSRHRRGEKKMS